RRKYYRTREQDSEHEDDEDRVGAVDLLLEHLGDVATLRERLDRVTESSPRHEAEIAKEEGDDEDEQEPVRPVLPVEGPHGYASARRRSARQRRHSASRRPSSASSPRSVGR